MATCRGDWLCNVDSAESVSVYYIFSNTRKVTDVAILYCNLFILKFKLQNHAEQSKRTDLLHKMQYGGNLSLNWWNLHSEYFTSIVMCKIKLFQFLYWKQAWNWTKNTILVSIYHASMDGDFSKEIYKYTQLCESNICVGLFDDKKKHFLFSFICRNRS